MNLLWRFDLFWYPKALIFFLSCWHNIGLVIEEDLSPHLLWRYRSISLFTKKSAPNLIASWLIKLIRLLLGILAYLFLTLGIIIVAVLWFATPVLLFVPQTQLLALVTLLFGLAIFIDHVWFYPAKKIWQIKRATQIWQTTKLKEKEVSWNSLLDSDQIMDFLDYLELHPSSFLPQKIALSGEMLDRVYTLAKYSGAKYTSHAHFWLAMMSEVPHVDRYLADFGLTIPDFTQALIFQEIKKRHWRKVFVWDEDFAIFHARGTNLTWIGGLTPLLDKLTLDLTKRSLAEHLYPTPSQTTELNQMKTLLSQVRDNSLCLVGPEGVGKKALIRMLAKQIVLGDVPPQLLAKRIVEVDLIKAGGKLLSILEEAKAAENVTIYAPVLSADLIRILEHLQLQFIATMTMDNYASLIQENTMLASLANKIEVTPLSSAETLQIIMHLATEFQRKDRISFSFLSLKRIVEMAVHNPEGGVLPAGAIKLLIQAAKQAEKKRVTLKTLEKIENG